jgi:hypothetical protein
MRSTTPERLTWSDRPLAELSTPAGPMVLTQSLTSGLARGLNDAPGVFWGVGDRGPNIKPADAARRYGLAGLASLAETEGAKVMPLPLFGPSIARFRLDGTAIELEEVIPLRTPSGKPLSRLPTPRLPATEWEPVFALDGTALGTDCDGADTEGIAVLPDGRFWIAEEYGPSLLLAQPDGVVVRRLVPEGAGQLFAESSIPTEERLPAIALARKLNRGFEALALSRDNRSLFLAFQSPLAHPDRRAHDAGDIVRIWELDASTGDFRAERAYPLDRPETFARDCAVGPVAMSDVKVSELAGLPDGSMLVLERVTLSTHIYRITVSEAPAVPACFVDPAHRPTLEQVGQGGAEAAGIPLLCKQLVLSTDEHEEVCGDLEGLVILEDGTLLLANDSDYGIEGAATQLWRVALGHKPALRFTAVSYGADLAEK